MMATRIVETVVEYKSQPPCKTAEEMEQICCEPTDALQCCEKPTETWQGHTALELLGKYHPGLDDLGRDSSGRYVVIELAPRKNPCGEKVIKYDVSAGKCCDEVETDVVFDTDATPDVLPHNSSIVVYATGGRTPYTFTTTSIGTYFSNNRKSMTISLPYIRLYADESFCGMTNVSITDGCSSDSTLITSDEGVWSFAPFSDSPAHHQPCIFPGEIYDSSFGGTYYKQTARYKMEEEVTHLWAEEEAWLRSAWDNDCYDNWVPGAVYSCECGALHIPGSIQGRGPEVQSTCLGWPPDIFEGSCFPGDVFGSWYMGHSTYGICYYSTTPYRYRRYGTNYIRLWEWTCV